MSEFKRTTEWWDLSNGLCGARIIKGVNEQTALTKLAAYEDSELEPSQVKAMHDEVVALRAIIDETIRLLKSLGRHEVN
jgi:hypothetical protein